MRNSDLRSWAMSRSSASRQRLDDHAPYHAHSTDQAVIEAALPFVDAAAAELRTQADTEVDARQQKWVRRHRRNVERLAIRSIEGKLRADVHLRLLRLIATEF